MVFIAPGPAAAAGHAARRRRAGVQRAARRRTTAGRSGTATTGSSTTRTSSSSSSRSSSPSRTRPSSARTRSAGALETDAETLVATQLAPRLQDEESVRELLARIDCPVLVIHGSDDAVRPCDSGARLAELDGRRARRSSRGRATSRTRATRSRSTCCCATSSTPAPPPRALGARQVPPQARALHLLADRARPRAARRRDRRRAAQAPSRPRDRLARPAPGHRGARGARRAHPSGQRASWPTSRTTSRASRPSTTCTASRRSGGWTRSCSPTSWSSTTSSASEQYDLWIGDEAWELDYYLHENPEQKRTPLRLADRLRRLAADARRRRPRGVPDRRLQRGDDRAHRPLPARARPGASSSATPTTSCPSAFGPDLPLIRDWTEEHFDFAGYVTGFDPAEFADRDALRAELGYARRRAGLHRHRRRLGRRRRPAAAGDRRLPGGEASGCRRCG